MQTLTGSLDKVTQLRGVRFNWKDPTRGTGNHIGFLAQELEAVYPEFVSEADLPDDEDGNAPIKSVARFCKSKNNNTRGLNNGNKLHMGNKCS